jgi:nitrate/nitrite transporter NarK
MCWPPHLQVRFITSHAEKKVSERSLSGASLGRPAPSARCFGSCIANCCSTLAFWLVTILHTLFICLYHLFLNFSGHFLIETYDLSPVAAGLVSSIMPLTVVLVAPLAGLLLDRLGGQLWVLLAASAATLLAYVLLQLHYSAICCIVLLSVCESFVPMILLSITPLTVDSSVYGAAFGLSEVREGGE